ncbi:hypothetical protein NE237_026578 [Protea cynaroides]|uniref:Uncharacterized protein n=1 Tax=Protea cynaroides TaxID=273540 RepID=A0A9Q0H3Z6_9MAGN|nr:hypothetical protein NE237_026578 [Protea cynaroides]
MQVPIAPLGQEARNDIVVESQPPTVVRLAQLTETNVSLVQVDNGDHDKSTLVGVSNHRGELWADIADAKEDEDGVEDMADADAYVNLASADEDKAEDKRDDEDVDATDPKTPSSMRAPSPPVRTPTLTVVQKEAIPGVQKPLVQA